MRFAPFRKSMLPAFRKMMRESVSEFGSAWAKHISLVFSSGAHWQNAENFAVIEDRELSAVFSLRREVDACVLYFLLIRKDRQGTGIGTAIVRFTEKFASKGKAKFIRLDAYAGKGATSFYKKLGFKQGGRVCYYEEDGDDQVFMYKKIK